MMKSKKANEDQFRDFFYLLDKEVRSRLAKITYERNIFDV